MANKKSTGFIDTALDKASVLYDAATDTLSDWWNAPPEKKKPYVKLLPTMPRKSPTGETYVVQNQPVSRPPTRPRQRYEVGKNDYNRTAPAPSFSAAEAASNLYENFNPLDFARDMVKGVYGAGKAVVTDPMGAVENAGKFAGTLEGIYDARQFEQTGKWPKKDPGGLFSLMTPTQLANWRREGLVNYRKLASYYSYKDEKTGERHFDSDALFRNISQNPSDILALLNPAVRGANARYFKLGENLGKTGKVIEGTGRVADIVANPLPFAIEKSVGAVTPAANATLRAVGVKPTVFTKAGEYTPKMQQAFKDAGIDPVLFNSPEMRSLVQTVVNEKGISAAAIKDAAIRSQGINPTRSMVTGERPVAGNVQDEGFVRQGAAPTLNQNMADNVEAAYQQATSHRGVFANTDDFPAGVRQSIEDELAGMGLTLADVQGNIRFTQSQKALQGEKGFPGVFDQFEDLSGKKGAAPLSAQDLSGEAHTFDYGKGHWVDAAGTPVTAPGKIQYLDAVSNRKNLPPPAAGPNNLTPQGIDSVRRNVNSRYSNAQGDDQAVLAAINRGIDNYTVNNAANFTGDGAAMAADWSNARKASQLNTQYGKAPEVNPFAPPRPKAPYDESAVARTDAVRDIIKTPADAANSTVPTVLERIKGYIPTTGFGGALGYGAGTALLGPGVGGYIGAGIGSSVAAGTRGALDRMAARRAAQAEFTGAPRVGLFNAPDIRYLRTPNSLAGFGTSVAQGDYNPPVAGPITPPVSAPKVAPPSNEMTREEYEKLNAPAPQQASNEMTREQYEKQYGPISAPISNEMTREEYEKQYGPVTYQPPVQPQARGGRTAYRAGGKVGGIEPLIQALMNKAKMAKKVSNKATEPLLNERDDAIASALAIAQKAI